MIDAGIYLRAYLVADAGIIAQVGTDARSAVRIYVGGLGSGVPQVDAGLMPRKCAVILASGGSPVGRRMPLLRPLFWIRCYGASILEAMEVFAAIFEALQRQQNQKVTVSGSNSYLYWSELNIEAQVLPEPTTEWPCCGSPFSCVFYEDAVA